MRIVHAVRQYWPGVGGIETYVSQLAERQARTGADVRVVTLDRIFDGDGVRLPAFEPRAGVGIERVPFVGGIRYPLAPAVLTRFSGADVVHVHGLEFLADYAALTRRLHRRPMVFSTHGGFFHTPFASRIKRAWFGTITRATLKAYHAVLASSVQDFETFRPVTDDRLALLENAVDTDLFAGLAKPGANTIIFFGRLAPNKEVGRLVAWFAGLHRRAPSWRLIIAGKQMGVTIAELREQAVAAGVGDATEFHHAPDGEQLRALIARSSVFACASSYEGFGLAAVEAIGAGLFPLLSDLPVFTRTLQRSGVGMATGFVPGVDVDRFLQAVAAFEAGIAVPPVAVRLAPFAWPHHLDEVRHHYTRAVAAGRDARFAVRPGLGASRRERTGDTAI